MSNTIDNPSLENIHDFNLTGYSQPAHFFVPSAFEAFHCVNMFAHDRYDAELFKDNALIDSVYGNVSMVWNGGRSICDMYLDKRNLIDVHNEYASCDMTVRFVCTNTAINEHDLYDRYANLVLDIFSDVPFEVVVNSPMLEEYLRSKYPNAQFISSTTKGISTLEALLEELKKDYKYVCIDHHFNKDFDALNAIPHDLRSRVEILVNEPCSLNCPMRNIHYQRISQKQLQFDIEECTNCPIESNPYETMPNGYIYNHQLEQYLSMGYNHFKIQGRRYSAIRLCAELLPYLIKPRVYWYMLQDTRREYRNFNRGM